MLSYQHIYHAANFADIHKHKCLAKWLQNATQTGKICYLETHAGRGLYNLLAPEALKTGEAQEAKNELENINETHILKKIIQDIRRHYGEDFYPGSAFIAAALLGEQDEIHLCELHPKEYAALEENFLFSTKKPQVDIYKKDGFSEILKHLSKHKTNLLFIDPSYEIKSEYEQTANFINTLLQKDKNLQIMVWYPLLSNEIHHNLLDNIKHPFEKDEYIFGDKSKLRSLGSGLALIGNFKV